MMPIAQRKPPTDPTAVELFDRSVATLVQSWAYLATGSPGAEVIEADGAAIAAFVRRPEREFLNNAVLARGIGDVAGALDTVERAYADRGIERYAIWVHESEGDASRAIKARGYAYDSSTRAMAMPTAELTDIDTSHLDLAEPSLDGFRRVNALSEDFFSELSVAGVHIYVARFQGEDASSMMAFDHKGDCGLYILGTLPAARRKGLASALIAHAVAEARERGCTTASLQSTEMAEGVYASVGFRDLGRLDEYVPG